jgi:type 1 fimbriae regulatory protein FimB/type 1 fimbriae regulatory protein FimE
LVKSGAPNIENGTVGRKLYSECRPREYLTDSEIAHLMSVARKRGRHGHRDATMILLGYRHGLRATELCSLRWDLINFEQGLIHVNRIKQGVSSTHPLRGVELRALRKLRRELPASPYLFVTERGSPISTSGFRKLVGRIGQASNLEFPIHPHMLRHACGYKLANEGHDTRAIQHYLGHKNIQHTIKYTELSAQIFQSFWKD